MRLREFNDDGIDRFREYLTRARQESDVEPPWELLDDRSLTRDVLPVVELDRPGFSTKRQAAEYLHEALMPLADRDILKNAGLWTWLSLYYFDDVCPKQKSTRRILKDYYYIYYADNGMYYYRHLLAVSYLVRLVAPHSNRLLLDTPLRSLTGIVESAMRQLVLTRIPCIFEVIDRLYYDESRHGLRPGALGSQPRAGDLKNRLPARIRQLQRTYDLHCLNADQLIQLLGPEFGSWLSR